MANFPANKHIKHVAPKEPDTVYPSGVDGDLNRAKTTRNIELTFARLQETKVQISVNVADLSEFFTSLIQ